MKKLLLPLLLATQANAQQVTKLPAQDKLLTGKPAVQFSIGAEDGADWELLSRVSQASFDKEENLYVLDAGNHRVLVFNAQGKFVRKFGKKGGGPGELMSPVGLAVTSDGYVAVTDLGRPAVSLYKKDGTFAKNITLGEDYGFPVMNQGTYAHPNGGVIVRTMPRMIRAGNPDEISAAPMRNRKSPVTWFTAADKTTKLFDIPQPDVTPKVNDSGNGSGRRQIGVRVMLPAFTAPTIWGVLPDGRIAVGYDENYRIQIARNGKVERVVERPFSPRKVTEADKTREKDRRRKEMAAGGGGLVINSVERTGNGGGTSRRTGPGGSIPKAMIDEMLNDLTFAETVPVLSNMYVDPTGRMWVQRNARVIGGIGPIDLIAVDGRYIGTITGQTLPVAVSASGRAAYIERDDMDVEKVVVRRLPANWK